MINHKECGIYVVLCGCVQSKNCTCWLRAITLPNRKSNTFIVCNGFYPKIKTHVTSIYTVVAEKNMIDNIGPYITGIFGLPLKNLCVLSTTLNNISMMKIETSAF